MMDVILQLRSIAAPPGSRRERIVHLVTAAFRLWKQEGFRVVVQRVYWKMRTRWQGSISTTISPSAYSYDGWIKDHEPDVQELSRQRQRAQVFTYKPLISIITPVYNPSPQVLRETIESVLAQTYSHWELCVVDGGSDVPGVKEVLDGFARKDSRIQVKHMERNLGIAGNSNEALQMAKGEFVVLLDHDDLLSPDMLYEVVSLLNQQPETDIIYFDEDKISEDGTIRRAPWFKPDAWSPDLLLSVNYLMHSVIRHTLLVEVGGFDPTMDGAQDWDLALRCTEKTKKIAHIPKVLYHWRQVKGSAAREANAKPWAFEAQARCVQTHLERLSVKQPKVVFPSLGIVRILWPISGDRVSIIIPTRDKLELLQACLSSILGLTDYPDYEVILVDTGSTQSETRHYYAELASDLRIHIIDYTGPFNYSAVNNLGARHASGDFLLFLNNDTEVLDADWLSELVGWAERPEVGVIGCKLLRPDGTIQHAGIVMGVEGHGSHVFDGDHEHHYGIFGSTEWYRDYMAVTGACMMMRRGVFEELRGFDEGYQVGYSDIEICLQAVSHGYRVVYTPFARLLHHEGGTRGFSLPPNDVLRAYFRMLPTIRAGDPFFNPNLSYVHRRPTIARPGEESRDDRLLRILENFGLVEGHSAGPFPTALADLPPLSSGSDEGRSAADLGKRLLLVTHDLSLSGAPLILYTLGKYLTRNGYSVAVLSPTEGPLSSLYSQVNIKVIIEPAILSDSRVVFSLLKDYGVVLINTILAWRAVYAARAFQKPCVWWIHESKFGQELARHNEVIAKALSTANAVIFAARATAASYAEFSAQNNFVSIHYGLDLELTGRSGDLFRKEPNTFYVVNVGSIEPRKGQDILLQGIAALPYDLMQAFEVYLVGRVLDRHFYKEISKMAKSMKNVHIVGEVPHEKALSYIQAADAFVLTSRDEVLPVTVLEAMHYGKGIISTNAGGVSEVIEHGVNGLIIEVEDHKGLTENLIRIFKDRDLLQELGDNARSKFHAYLTMSRFGEEMTRVIKQVAP